MAVAGPAQVTGSWQLWGSEWGGVKHPWGFKHPTEPAGQGEGEPEDMGVCWHGALPNVAPLRGDVAEAERAEREAMAWCDGLSCAHCGPVPRALTPQEQGPEMWLQLWLHGLLAVRLRSKEARRGRSFA